VAITKVQQSSLLTGNFSAAVWSPTTTTLTGVAAGNLVLALGGWWDAVVNTGGSQNIPANSNGTFVKAGTAAPNLPNSNPPPPGWPVAPELCEILSAAAGNHVVTPQNIFPGGGDGYFIAAEFTGGGAGTWSRVDDGYNFAGSGTAGAIDTVTVTTGSTNALIGDLVVSIGTCDGDPTAFGLSSPSNGSWNNIVTTSTSADNIGMGAAWRIATANGAQSAQWDIADSACELANAVIAVYRFIPSSVAALAWSNQLTQRPGRSPGRGAQRFYQSPKSTTTSINVTVALTGQAASFALGSVGPTNTVAALGQSAASAAGSVAASNAHSLTGQSAAFAAGALVPSAAIAVAGQSAVFAAGTLAPSATMAVTGILAAFTGGSVAPGLSVNLIGTAALFAAGNVTAPGNVTVALNGQAATFAAGIVLPNASVAVSGQSAGLAAGSVVSAFAVPLTGQATVFAAGAATPSTSTALTGLASVFAAGAAVPSSAVPLTGKSATFAGGSLAPSLALALVGQPGVFASGTVSPSGALTISLTGQAAAFAAGALGSSRTMAVAGQSAAVTGGTLTPQMSAAASGQAATFACGSLVSGMSIALTGRLLASSQGLLAPSIAIGLAGQPALFTQGFAVPLGSLVIGLTGSRATFSSGVLSPNQFLIGSARYLVRRLRARRFTITATGGDFTVQRVRARRFTVSNADYLDFEPLYAGEKIPLTFDLTPDLAADELPAGVILVAPPTVTVTLASGVDANPTAILNGSPGLDAAKLKVIVPVQPLIGGNKYLIKVQCASTQANFAPIIIGTLPVL
jgi:hypothetical protein